MSHIKDYNERLCTYTQLAYITVALKHSQNIGLEGELTASAWENLAIVRSIIIIMVSPKSLLRAVETLAQALKTHENDH